MVLISDITGGSPIYEEEEKAKKSSEEQKDPMEIPTVEASKPLNEYAMRVAYVMRSYLHMHQAATAGVAVPGEMPPALPGGAERPADRCKAMMEVVRKEHRKWVVSKLVLEHNHALKHSEEHGKGELAMLSMGMEFESAEAAKAFYYSFGELSGFKARTGSNRRSAGSGALIMQRFLCWCGNYLMYRKQPDPDTGNRKRGPYKKRRRGTSKEAEKRNDDVLEVIDVQSSEEKPEVVTNDCGAAEVQSGPSVREVRPAEAGNGQEASATAVMTTWGKDDGQLKSKGNLSQVAETVRMLRELGVKVSRYTNDERRDVILKYMMKRNNRNFPVDRPLKVTSRQALAERRRRGIGGKFLSKDEVQTMNSQLETTEAESDSSSAANAGREPKIGMVFPSEEKAYEFYVRYAGTVGFSVRKGWWDKSAGNVTRSRVYVCSREGFRPKTVIAEEKKTRPETRTGCAARMVIIITSNAKYCISQFVRDHNHQLAAPLDVHMLRSQRLLNRAQTVRPQKANLIPSSYKNYLRTKRMKDMQIGDAGALLGYLQQMKGDNPSFFYAIQVDEDDQLTNIFWTDINSQVDYNLFGDAVCLDTTYRENDYGRPLALFIGVNHHKQIIIFGAALLYDESVESFKWLFESFKMAFAGKQPQTFLTDRCTAITDAVAAVWEGTSHRYCLRHIYLSGTKHISLGLETFSLDFSRCVYDIEEEQEFLPAWSAMLEKYDLRENEWLARLYEDREKWAPIYGQEIFSAGITNILRGEKLTTVLKEWLSPKKDLSDFLKQYQKLMDEQRHAELQAEYCANQDIPVIPPLRLLWQAARTYTPAVFNSFKVEFDLLTDCMVYFGGEVRGISEYEVAMKEKKARHFVRYDASDDTMHCSCKMFESVGIQCCHVLKVLDFRNVKELPAQYVLKRWSKDAKSGSTRGNNGIVLDGDNIASLPKHYNSLTRMLYEIASRAAENAEASAFLESQSGQLLEQVEQILRAKSLEKSPLSTAFKGQQQNSVQNETEQGDINSGSQRASSKIKRDGAVRRKNHNNLEMNRRKKAREGQSDVAEAGVTDHEQPAASNNVPSQPTDSPNLFFASSQFMQGSYVPAARQFGLGPVQGFHGMAQFSQDSSATVLHLPSLNAQISQNVVQSSRAPDMNSLQFVEGTQHPSNQITEQGHYAIPVWDFL